jgi:hypothetical protein
MYIPVHTFYDFVRVFEETNRVDQFKGEAGLRMLFDYLNTYEEDTGKEVAVDPIKFTDVFIIMTLEEYANESKKNPEVENSVLAKSGDLILLSCY